MPLSLVSGDTGSWSVKSAAPALILRHLVVCGHTHNCSPVPPVLSHDRFCGTSQWRQGLERQKHGVVACGQHKHLRSSLVDSSCGTVLVAVSCCVAKWCCVAYPATNTRSRRVQQEMSVGQEDVLGLVKTVACGIVAVWHKY